MRSNTRLALWVLVAFGALAALKTAGTRWHAESLNRRVAIVLDWDEVRTLSEETATPVPEVLRQFRGAGAEGIAIGEDTLGDLEARQEAEVMPPKAVPGTPAEMVTRLRIPDDRLRNHVLDVLKHKWSMETDRRGETTTIQASWSELSSLAIGLPVDVVRVVQAAGLQVVPRVSNFIASDSLSIEWAMEALRAEGASLVIFGGDQVLGYPDLTKETALALNANGLLFGQVEFGKQKGEEEMARELNGSLVRVHSISPAEMARTAEPDAVDRFLRAAEERNIRALYVRMLSGAPHPAVDTNVSYVNDIKRALESHRFSLGPAHPYEDYDSKAWERCVMGLGVGAATLLAMMYAWPAAGGTLTMLILLALLDVLLPATSIGRKLVALQGAVLMPFLGFLMLRASLEKRPPRASSRRHASLRKSVMRAIPLFMCASATSLLGALFVVGLLSSRLGSMHIVDFMGIKAQQAGAILAVAGVLYLDISSKGGLFSARERVKRRVAEIWSQPLLVGSLVIFLAAMIALALLLARSGNDPGVGVSTVEMKFRAVLERVMGVRPRTKEFLIGHPALFLGIALLSLRRMKWGLPLLVVGAIGQVSIVNTFCHLHTPLAVSTFRVFNGLWTGLLVALVVAWAADRYARRQAE